MLEYEKKYKWEINKSNDCMSCNEHNDVGTSHYLETTEDFRWLGMHCDRNTGEKVDVWGCRERGNAISLGNNKNS